MPRKKLDIHEPNDTKNILKDSVLILTMDLKNKVIGRK